MSGEVAHHLPFLCGCQGIERLKVGVQLALVSVDADEGGGEVANLVSARHIGVRAIERQLLIEHELVLAVACLHHEVVAARGQPFDVEGTVDGHHRSALLAHAVRLTLIAAACRLFFDIGNGEEGAHTHFALNVVYLIVVAQKILAGGIIVADIRLHVVAVARQRVVRLGGSGFRHRQHARHRRVARVVADGNFLPHHRFRRLAPQVAHPQFEVVDAVFHGEALHVEEGEVHLVEAPHRRAPQVVLLGVAQRVALLQGDGHLGGGAVAAVLLLLERHRPGVEAQIGLHIGALLLGEVEGAVGEHRLHLHLLLRPARGTVQPDNRKQCRK